MGCSPPPEPHQNQMGCSPSLHSKLVLPNPSIAGMSRRRPPHAAASSPPLESPLDSDDILEEILLRLPPEPSSLPRASLVCTRWRRILSDPGFLGRFRKHHRRNKPPPLLGFFDKEFSTDEPPIFHPTLGPRDRIPPARFTSPWSSGEHWAFLGCRHGLALLISQTRHEAVMWDPLTGHQRRVAFPPGFGMDQGRYVRNAAVMCAAAEDGHVHGDCPITPFRLVVLSRDSHGTQQFACLYESESGEWGNIVSVETQTATSISVASPSVLVRNAFCWLLSGDRILEFDFRSQSLAVIQRPADALPVDDCLYYSFSVVRTEHSGPGLAVLSELDYVSHCIQLWERKPGCDGVVGWVLQKTILLDGLFPPPGPTMGQSAVMMQGYDEDANAVFLSTFSGDHMLQLDSEEFTNLSRAQRGCLSTRTHYPYRNFYTAGSWWVQIIQAIWSHLIVLLTKFCLLELATSQSL